MLQPFLREVSRGKRRARDLSYDEAVQAMQAFIQGRYTDSQAGAFLIAERIKMESADEIKGFTDALRAESRIAPLANGLDCAGPFDGRNRSFFATFPSAFILGARGVPVTLPASAPLPPKNGITLLDLLQVVRQQCADADNADANARSSSETEPAKVPAPIQIIDAEQWCPPLAQFRALRIELGMRTLFNSVEKLLRFTDAPYMALGIFHGTVFHKMAEALLHMNVTRGLIVQGIEGSEDLPVDKRTRCFLVSGGNVEELVIDPDSYGLQCAMPERTWNPQVQVLTAEQALLGKAEPAFQNMTILNSGIRLWLTGIADTIDEGIATARQTIAQGLAWQAYNQWRARL